MRLSGARSPSSPARRRASARRTRCASRARARTSSSPTSARTRRAAVADECSALGPEALARAARRRRRGQHAGARARAPSSASGASTCSSTTPPSTTTSTARENTLAYFNRVLVGEPDRRLAHEPRRRAAHEAAAAAARSSTSRPPPPTSATSAWSTPRTPTRRCRRSTTAWRRSASPASPSTWPGALGPWGINVNAIAPGVTMTEATKKIVPEGMRELARHVQRAAQAARARGPDGHRRVPRVARTPT